MKALIYDPDTRRIIACATAPDFDMEDRPHLVVDDYAAGLTRTHRMTADFTDVEPRDPAELDAENREFAVRDIRVKRDAILASEFDPLVSNPIRWSEVPQATKDEILAWRLVLLDATNTPDPLNYIFPEMPGSESTD